jgi:hypothetical protein
MGGAFAFSFFIMFALASCTEGRDADGSVVVEDRANLLSPAARSALSAIKFPKGIPVLVRTVYSIPLHKIGSFATELMSEEPAWQTLRPRGFLRKHVRQDPPWAPGVYVLVSSEPKLLQVRFGEKIRLAAYQERIAAGSWYRERQEFSSATLEQHLTRTVEELAGRTAAIADPRWPLSWARALSSWVASDVEDYLAPSDGLFSKQVLSKYILLADWLGGTGSAWRFVTFNVLVFVALWGVGKKLFVERVIVRLVKAQWGKPIMSAAADAGILGALVTGFIALGLLSRGRMEDQLALDALGLPFLSVAAFGTELHSSTGGLWLAIPAAILALIPEVIEASRATEQARAQGETRKYFPHKWLGWACALFLLPLAIGIPALAILFLGAAKSLHSIVLSAKEREDRPAIDGTGADG